jgi:hypothetical protein
MTKTGGDGVDDKNGSSQRSYQSYHFEDMHLVLVF